ncbi:MAG: hypothetical protein ACOYKN_16890 [Pirellula sp.]
MNRTNSSIWVLDLAIGLLGVLVVVMVLRVFRFDDPRILFNAWTYCLAIPTVIISSSMLAHVMIPQSADRSIQAGFLLSVLVHLGLTVAAINTVLFSGLWKEGSEKIEMKLKSMSQGTSFQPSPVSPDRSEPDYLRPVQNQIDPASQVDLRPATEAQKALELLDTANEPVDAKKNIQDQQLAEQEMLEPQLADEQAQALDRPDLMNTSMPRQAIQAESVEQTPLAQDSLPEAKPLSIDRTAIDRTPIAQSESLDRSTAVLPAQRIIDVTATRIVDGAAQAGAPARIERELAQPMQPSNDSPELRPTPQDRIERLGKMPRTQSTAPIVPIDPGPSSSNLSAQSPGGSTDESLSNSLGDLLGNRGELSRRNPSTSASARSGSGGIEWKDPIAGRIASTAATRMPAELPSLSDAGSSTPGLDRFRPSSNAIKGTPMGLVPIPAAAFEQRQRRMDESSNQELKAMGPLGPKTEESIERGLEFLAKHQRSDGSWKLEDYGQRTMIRSDTAATALSLLSFQGAGYSHVQFKYQNECRKAIEFLVAGQQANGDLYRPMDDVSDRNGWIYSHAIATLALCEAYGMTQDENLRTNAQRAVDFLVYSQDRQEGGWRYVPRVGSDTSVTGWGMMALKSAELSGLYVPKQTYEGIQKWLEHSQSSARERYLYRYNWLANTPETKHGAVPTPVMTSVGLLMRLYTGWRRDNTAMARGADWLLERRPAMGTEQASLRDTYYWYYATQVLFHMGGDRWKAWYESLYPMLIETQVVQGPYAGSWEPLGPIPDAWGEYAGRLYVTTMNLLSLEVTYRHLPIYEATSR